jgi:hypothetical protein
MSKHGLWTVIMEDKIIIKKIEEFSVSSVKALKIEDDSFWSQSKFSNIHAIQFSDDGVDNDQVEYKDNSPNSSYDENILGNFRTEFISKWDSVYLIELQNNWDSDDKDANGDILVDETVEAKTIRLGARPTSYTST